MKQEEVLKRLIELQTVSETHPFADTELNHEEADKLLADFLTELGYKDIAEEYNKIFKWYA